MGGKSQISKYLILSIIILAVGLPTAYALTITLGGTVDITEILNMMGNKITNVGTPTVSTDAATKGYVDSSLAPSTDTLALLGCTNNQIAQFVGSVWTCVPSPGGGTVTSVGTGTGLTGGPITDFGTISIDTAVVPSLLAPNTFQNDVTVDGNLLVAEGSFTVNQAAIFNNFIDLTGTSAIDDDTIFFDDGTSEFLRWDESANSFAFSNDLDVSGDSTISGNLAVSGATSGITWNSRVPQSTTLTTVDSAGTVGFDISITIGTDGLPVISYRDPTNSALKVAHCTNASCSTFDTPTTIDSTGDVGRFTSITIGTDGLPVISYEDLTNNDLKVVHCKNVSCSGGVNVGFDPPTAVDFVGVVGTSTSITIGTDGFPVISYLDSTNTALKVAHCTNASCSASTTATVDSAGSVGSSTSITIGTDGLPVISYEDITNSDLKVAHCENATCDPAVSPATITTVDNTGLVGFNTSITIGTDGLPVISYRDATNLNLKVVHCLNVSCSGIEGVGFDTPTAIDSAVNVASDTSITIGTDGFPVISYRDNTNFDLKVAYCTNASCSTSTTTTVDSTGDVGISTSITIGTDGFPVISYREGSPNNDLKVAKCTNPYCLNNWIRR